MVAAVMVGWFVCEVLLPFVCPFGCVLVWGMAEVMGVAMAAGLVFCSLGCSLGGACDCISEWSCQSCWSCSSCDWAADTQELHMKSVSVQIAAMLQHRSAKRNIGALVRLFLVLGTLIGIYSVLFHVIMLREGQEHSWLTGFYWTLTVMSTLGFGDITFHSDLGRLFSILVLLTGVIFLLILLPFTVIQFFYVPWVEAQAAARTPRELPADTRGHVILTNDDPVSSAFIRKLEKFNYEYVLVVPEIEKAMQLHDQGVHVVLGHLDDPETYRQVRADQAALVISTQNDLVNTNIIFTVRQVAPDVPLAATADKRTSMEVLERAGATNVLNLSDMMGKALARCMVGGDAITHVVGSVDGLLIAEANASRTPLVGKTLRENRLSDLGVSVIGIWDRGDFQNATPDTVVGENTILLLAGSAEHFLQYDEHFAIYNNSVKPVVILGGGRVGRAAAQALDARGVDYRIIERDVGKVRDAKRTIIGDATDPQVLREAGLDDAPAVLITTHDDNLNTYAAIYCRSVRSDILVICRSTLERNTETLHRAGADFVFSYASMGATSLLNLIKGRRIISIAEGLDVFRLGVPKSLEGKTIVESGVRKQTGCTILAIRDADAELLINPPPHMVLEASHEMVLVGSMESESEFLKHYSEG